MRIGNWTYNALGQVSMRVEVRIYESRRSMRIAIKRKGNSKEAVNAHAACVSDVRIQDWRGIHPVAYLFFCREYLTLENIAHEVTHAMQTYTNALARERRVSWGIREIVADATGKLVATIQEFANQEEDT